MTLGNPRNAQPDLELTTMDQLDPLLKPEGGGKWLLFKHSTRCPISAHANREYEDWLDSAGAERARTARVLVVEQRPISLAIAERLKVRHESPQAILIENGKVLWHASHHSITAEELKRRCG
jgi:bacillithiol system protein YtxJ